MKIESKAFIVLRALICAAAVWTATSAKAQVAYRFTLNTSPLIGASAGLFYLDFQLSDGSGAGDANNTAWLSNFQFGGGNSFGAVGGAGSFGGNLSSAVSLTDGSFFNEFYQAFTPGAWLQFDLNLTTRVDSGSTPDSFAFAILDGTLSNLPTLSAGSDVFASIDITSSSPTVRVFAGNGAMSPAAGGPPIVLAAPMVVPVPEPSTYGLAATSTLLGLIVLRRRLRS